MEEKLKTFSLSPRVRSWCSCSLCIYRRRRLLNSVGKNVGGDRKNARVHSCKNCRVAMGWWVVHWLAGWLLNYVARRRSVESDKIIRVGRLQLEESLERGIMTARTSSSSCLGSRATEKQVSLKFPFCLHFFLRLIIRIYFLFHYQLLRVAIIIRLYVAGWKCVAEVLLRFFCALLSRDSGNVWYIRRGQSLHFFTARDTRRDGRSQGWSLVVGEGAHRSV